MLFRGAGFLLLTDTCYLILFFLFSYLIVSYLILPLSLSSIRFGLVPNKQPVGTVNLENLVS